MKSIIIVFVLLIVVSSQFCNVMAVDNGFEDFTIICSKHYSSETERATRREIFLKACKQIKDLRNGNLQYSIGSNCNSDRLMSQLIPSKFITPPLANAQPFLERQKKILANDLTANSSIYRNWNALGKVSEAKDQGGCGGCWAFATTALAESIFMIFANSTYDLSEEYTLECTYEYNPRKFYYSSCSGGVMDEALEMQVHTGIPQESVYPYAAKSVGWGKPNTIKNCFSGNAVYHKMTKQGQSAKWYRFDNLNSQQIRMLLYEAPVAVAFYVETTFYSYKSGVYACPVSFAVARSRVNHAMLLVGQDEEGNYIVKNSWGTTWGVNGFATISATADCGLSAYVYSVSFVFGRQLASSLLALVFLFMM